MGRNISITKAELDILLKDNPNISVNHRIKRGTRQKLKLPNRTEKSFHGHLLDKLAAGEITRVEYEYHQIQILEPDPAHRQKTKMIYTPDFSVWLPSGEVEFYEVKGRIMDNTQVRFKLAVALCKNHRFYFVMRTKTGWSIKLQPAGKLSGEVKLHKGKQNEA